MGMLSNPRQKSTAPVGVEFHKFSQYSQAKPVHLRRVGSAHHGEARKANMSRVQSISTAGDRAWKAATSKKRWCLGINFSFLRRRYLILGNAADNGEEKQVDSSKLTDLSKS